MTALFAFCSFAVDWGRAQLSKSELRRAADSVARAAVAELPHGVSAVYTAAEKYAALNIVDGQATTIVPAQDIAFGYWGDPADLVDDEDYDPDDEFDYDTELDDGGDVPPPQFIRLTPGDPYANAIRVTLRRTAARGNAVPTVFARLLGQNSCDVHATATAVVYTHFAGEAFTGIKKLKVYEKAQTDSYASAAGAYSPGSTRERGTVKTNYKIKLKKDTVIRGDARPGVKKPHASGGIVTGTRAPLPELLKYLPVPVPQNLPLKKKVTVRGSQTFAAGEYYFDELKIEKNSTLTFTGPVTVYVRKKFEIKGTVKTYQNRPENLRVRFVSTKKGDFKVAKYATAGVYADVYNPMGKAKIDKNIDFYGALIAKDLKINKETRMHYDESLFWRVGAEIQLVE